MDISILNSRLKSNLVDKGYKIHSIPPHMKFSWRPDILASKGGKLYAFIIRQTDFLPEPLVQRIASMRTSKLNVSIIFCKKPNKTSSLMLKMYGIGIGTLLRGNLIPSRDKIKPKKILIKKTKKDKIKPPKTDVFVSSHQVIQERQITKEIIKELNSTYFFPIYAILVEEDPRYKIAHTKECIQQNLKECNQFLCILSDEYRNEVEKELNASFEEYGIDDIKIFIRSSKKCKTNWAHIIREREIKKDIKYMEYSDLDDFRIKLRRSLVVKMTSICRKLGLSLI
ncbi:hypothetical protein HYX06_02155 [Candidatus Woesearchaeota archaeon]|nr:hypothetical protein [Candidatus Woesearchaeota archaeon]